MNRRRFLKYAGATAAIVGASALGLDYAMKPPFAGSNQTTSASVISKTESTTATTSVRTTDFELTLFADWHGDGKQQPDEPTVKDIPVEITGIDTDYKAVLVADSERKYWARNIPVGRRYQIVPKTDKFRYIALSNSELRGINDYQYAVDSSEPSLQLGLMEGFLTLPFRPATKYFVGIDYETGRYYDRDTSPSTYLWWNGKSGQETFTGYGVSHVGTDFGADYGVPVVASAPGVVFWVGTASHGEIGVQVTHVKDTFTTFPSYGVDTDYLHLSKTLVSTGQFVSRGDVIGLCGESGTYYTHVHFDLFYRTRDGPLVVDPYQPLDGVYSGTHCGYWLIKNGTKMWKTADDNDPRNRTNYWTKDNEPQFPV